MKKSGKTLLTVLLTLLVNAMAVNGQEGTEREKVTRFLRENVIGKTVAVKTVSKIDRGRIETDFSRKAEFVNFIESKSGFSFDVVNTINQASYDLDKNGERIAPGKKLDRVIVIRYEFVERESSKKMIGLALVIANTSADIKGSGSFVRIKLDSDQLILDESTIGYGDFFAQKGGFRPGAVDVRYEIGLVEGKLRRKSTTKNYDVDTETMERKPTGESPSVMVDEEVMPQTKN